MSDLVLVDRLGDINFGAPDDLAADRKPWAFYDILGVPRDAPPQQINSALKDLSKKNHPDAIAQNDAEAQAEAHKRQKVINAIKETLLDDGGELGPEWSQRRLYDQTSRYGEFFGTAHIEHKGKRTGTITETLLDVLELRKREVKAENEFKKADPELAEYFAKYEEAQRQFNRPEAEKYAEMIISRRAAKAGMSVNKYVQKQKEAQREEEKRLRERDKVLFDFRDKLARELKAPYGGVTEVRTDKIFDIWYNGTPTNYSNYSPVKFLTRGGPYCSVVGFSEADGIVTMGLKSDALFTGMRKVHFKAEHAQVQITDAHLEGIFQIAHGSVVVEYEGSSYGAVLRVRAPRINRDEHFVQHDDLYVPRSFATEGWTQKAPVLDIAVFDGTVDIQMKKEDVQERSRFSGRIRGLDDIIREEHGNFFGHSDKGYGNY